MKQLRNVLALALIAVVVAVVVVLGLDRISATDARRTTGTVVSFGSGKYKSSSYVDVRLEGGGVVRASNRGRVAVVPGATVEVTESSGSLLGSRFYSVDAVLAASETNVRVSDGTLEHELDKRSFESEIRVAVGLLGLLSLVSIVHLWALRVAPTPRKLSWTAILMVPLFGPLFYYVLFEPPSVQPEVLRAKRTYGDEAGSSRV